MMRNFAAELAAARAAFDWEAHSRIWEDRRMAEVDYDESCLEDLACGEELTEKAREMVASDPRNAEFVDWRRSVLEGEHDNHHEVQRALDLLR